jgi:dihydroxyacetone kinase-like protein
MVVILDGEGWVNLIRAAAARIEHQSAYLSELDAVVGDGDHGTGLAQALRAAASAVRALQSPRPAQVVRAAGQSLQDNMGGAAGVLFGAFLLGLGSALHAESTTSSELPTALAAGMAQVQRRGRAVPGDKTMLDALEPALAAAQDATQHESEAGQVMRAVASAAMAGALATRGMVARQGRAKFLGERSLGYQDAGATSLALIFEAWADHLEGTQDNDAAQAAQTEKGSQL